MPGTVCADASWRGRLRSAPRLPSRAAGPPPQWPPPSTREPSPRPRAPAHQAAPGGARSTAAASSASRTPTARARPPPTPPRGAGPPWPPRAWPHTTGTAHASCMKTRAGTPRDSRDTAPWRSRSQTGRNPNTAAPARRRSRARTRSGVRSAPPTAPSPPRTTNRKGGTEVSREGSAAGKGFEVLRTGRRSVPSAAWTDLRACPLFARRARVFPNLLTRLPWRRKGIRPTLPHL